ncbi:phosphoglycerate mutase family protein [Penicillium frequentans]|nr:phosphoglycerate mutase family protein [Penicillium glabrum]
MPRCLAPRSAHESQPAARACRADPDVEWTRIDRDAEIPRSFGCCLLAVADPIVYLIRHGEKPSNGSDGLSAAGLERAQCLKNVFGASSGYDIGHIMAETPKSSGSRQRPYDTVEPLAEELGLTVDTSCGKTDYSCVKDVVDAYDGDGNILICWEHDALTNIVEELGDDDAPDYPDDSYNIIWTDPSPYTSITAETSEDCPGLDS